VKETKRKLLDFLITAKRQGKSVAGYGAPGKGNTLLNYAASGRTSSTTRWIGVRTAREVPAGHPRPDLPPREDSRDPPDYVLILPWNLRDEIIEQMSHIREWGGQFVVPIPEVKVYP